MRTIAAVLFPDFEMLDLYGPLEMFAMHRDDFEIRTVAQAKGPVRASGGPDTVAVDDFSKARYDILLVPGGMGTRAEIDNPAMIDWLQAASEKAEIVSSVCTGSMLLAQAGLLAGRRATTNKRAFDWVVDHTPNADWQRSARWCVDGKFYTSSGVSAGMDMALAIIAETVGPDAARNAALWAEYTPNTDPDNDPFAVEDTP